MEEPLNFWETRARNMYLAYGSVTDFKNFQNNPMPEWSALPDKQKSAWIAAAKRAQIDVCNLLLTQTVD